MKHPAQGAPAKPTSWANCLGFRYQHPWLEPDIWRQPVLDDRIHLPVAGWSLRMAHTLGAFSLLWDELAAEASFFLQSPFLQAIEQAPPRQMHFVYFVFYYHNRPCGIAYGQLLNLNMRESLQAPLAAETGWMGHLKRRLASLAHFQVLVCGNMLQTGAQGFHFADTAALPPHGVAQLLKAAFQCAVEKFRAQGRRVNILMIKDLHPAQHALSGILQAMGFSQFSFQPSMSLRLNPAWQSLDDYLEAMSSKYRVRARRAFKKKGDLERRAIDTAMHCPESSAMFELYQEIAAHADFNAFALHPGYFCALAENMPGQFRVWGYYLQGQLIGFYSSIQIQGTMEAHFMGFKNAFNASHHLYLNMLYDMVADAIHARVHTLHLARTAMEIKSSVGAEPEYYHCFIKHLHPLANWLMPYCIRFMEPQADWTPRHPFRRQEA